MIRIRACAGILSVTILALAAATTHAQSTSGARITGVVRDSSARAIDGADIIVHPGGRRTRTDSAGKFAIDGLDAGKYTLRARKLGFAPTSWDVTLTKAGGVDVNVLLDRTPQVLDTLLVLADRPCPERSVEGFLCRRQRKLGLFLDYTDIDDKEVTYTGELFRDIPGFRVDLGASPAGPTYSVNIVHPARCVNSLVNGRPASPGNVVPELSSSLAGIEIYMRPDSVPEEYKRYTWRPSGGGRCALIVYWTDGFRHGSVTMSRIGG